jgi:hypothetical protein
LPDCSKLAGKFEKFDNLPNTVSKTTSQALSN